MSVRRRLLLAGFVVGLAVSITVAELALVLLALDVVWTAWRRRERPGPWPLLMPMAFFAAATVLAALASAHPLASLAESYGLLTLGAFYVVLFALPDARAARQMLVALFWAMTAVAALSLVQVTFCPSTPPPWPVLGRLFRKCERAHGFYSIYMSLAGVLLLVLLSTSHLVRGAEGRRAHLLAWLLGAAALVYTYVRGAFVGLATGVVVSATLGRRRLAPLVGGVAAILAVSVLISPAVRARIEEFVDPQDDTVRDRIAMVKAGLRMARDHPLLGVGPGGVQLLYPAYAVPEALRHRTSHLHNTPLQVLAERGVIGLAAWLALFATFLVRGLALRRRLPANAEDHALVSGTVAAVAGFLAGGLFEYNFGDTEVLLVATVVMALPFVIEREIDGTAAALRVERPAHRRRRRLADERRSADHDDQPAGQSRRGHPPRLPRLRRR